jgi:photosystem II stability/assembly factor-like uncharacterized protein
MRRRVIVALMPLLVAFTGASMAHAAELDVTELNAPTELSAEAQTGLFTSIVTAGSRLIAVGERGRIMLSDDSGASWHQVATPTSVTLTAVRFATSSQGWAVGNMGVVLHTTDGGATWQPQLNGVQDAELMMVQAQADAAAQGLNDTTKANLQSARLLVRGGPDVPLLAVEAISARDVIVGGGFGLVLVSHDSGAHWQSLYDQLPNVGGLNIYGIIGLADRTIFAGEQGFVAVGGGGKYQLINANVSGSLFGGLTTRAGSVLLYGLQGELFRSTDKGATWQPAQSGVSDGIDCAAILHDGTILIGDVSGAILASHDDGRTFTDLIQIGQPVVALAQAPDGAIIIGGPRGLQRIALPPLAGRSSQ